MSLRFILIGCIALTGAWTLLAAPSKDDSGPSLISRTGGKGGDDLWDSPEARVKAAEQGNPLACYELGEIYLAGKNVPVDVPKAIDFLTRAANGGHANAAFRLGKLYDDGELVEKDGAKAATYYQRAALAGTSEAQYNLGAMYSSGRGVKRDYAEGLAWLTIATKNGAPADGENQLRAFLTKGGRTQVIAAGEARAAELKKQMANGKLEKPANTDTSTAPVKPPAPGVTKPPQKIQIDPRGGASAPKFPVMPTPMPEIKIPEKPGAATPPTSGSGPAVKIVTPSGDIAQWPNLATLEAEAEKGKAEALAGLGQILLAGKIVPADPERAVGLLERGAIAGSTDAAYNIAEVYTNGVHAPRNDEKAFTYYLQAAKGGAPLAIFNVGALYTNGRGTAKNYTEALAWFILAKKYSFDKGMEQRIREALQKNSPDQIAVAEKRALEIEQAAGGKFKR